MKSEKEKTRKRSIEEITDDIGQQVKEIQDDLVPKYAIQPLQTALLVKFAKGELDMKKLAREELRSRGLNLDGQWVGFDAAERERS